MRTIIAAISLLLGLNLPVHAAMFSCQFFGGPTPPPSCMVDSTKIAPCRQTYSANLIAWCQGGTDIPSHVNHLGCFFATPEAEAAAAKQTLSADAFAKGTATGPGVHATAMQWLPSATAPGNNMGLAYSDGSGSYIVLCNVTKPSGAGKARK